MFGFFKEKAILANLAVQERLLESIADEFFTRRKRGERTDQTKAALYAKYCVTRPRFTSDRYNPVPGGHMLLMNYSKDLPDEARMLGEVAYVVCCERGIYPKPRGENGPLDGAREHDAMRKICDKCRSIVVADQVAGRTVDPSLWEAIKRWSEIEYEIADALLESSKRDELLRLGECSKGVDITEGASPKEGIFRTRWLMRVEEALRVLPQIFEKRSLDSGVEVLAHYGRYQRRDATFSYFFFRNSLTLISVSFEISSEKHYRKTHMRLLETFGSMNEPHAESGHDLVSRGIFDRLRVEHSLSVDDLLGTTETITFRVDAD